MSCIVNVSTNSNNIIDVSVNNSLLDVNIGKYDGEYVVIPLAERQTVLETAEKLLLENIVVKEIPYYETSNSAGGDTVYIGSEVITNG